LRDLFDIAEKLGQPDPFKFAGQLSKKAFIYWRIRKQLKLTKFHSKDEYYLATLISCLKTQLDHEPRTVADGLITFRTDEEAIRKDRERQEKEDKAFMASAVAISKKVNKHGR
jgi:hypothetical protein